MAAIVGTSSSLDHPSGAVATINHTIPAGCKMVMIICCGWDQGLGSNPTFDIDHDGNLDVGTEIVGAAAFNTSGGQFMRAYTFDEDHADWPSSLPNTADFDIDPSGNTDNRLFIINLDEKVIRDSDSDNGSASAIDFPAINSSVDDLTICAISGWDGGDPLSFDDGDASQEIALVVSGVDAWVTEIPGEASTTTIGLDANSSVSYAGCVISVEGTSSGVTGSGAPSIPIATASGTGEVIVTGTGAPSIPLATASGAGNVANPVSGSGAPSIPIATAAGTGNVGVDSVSGSGAPSLPMATASGAGEVIITGSGAATIPLATASGTGNVADPPDVYDIGGPVDLNLPVAAAAGSGDAGVTGSGAASAPIATASGAGNVVPPPVSGTGAASAPIATASGAGNVVPPPVSGTGAASAPIATASGTGVVTNFPTGSGAPNAPMPTASGTGTSTGGTPPDNSFKQTRRALMRISEHR